MQYNFWIVYHMYKADDVEENINSEPFDNIFLFRNVSTRNLFIYKDSVTAEKQ